MISSAHSFTRVPARIAITSAAVLLCACASGEKKADTTVPAGTMTPATAPAGATASGMAGDADHDFLRMMSDHHKGLIQIVHMTKEKKDVGTAAHDATKLDTEQDKELDQMVTMLEKEFKDPYEPKVMPEHQQMADELRAKSGKEYVRLFYQDVIKHHEEAVKMVDDYLPAGRNASLKQMAQTMRADQQKEIQAYQQKIAKLGA